MGIVEIEEIFHNWILDYEQRIVDLLISYGIDSKEICTFNRGTHTTKYNIDILTQLNEDGMFPSKQLDYIYQSDGSANVIYMQKDLMICNMKTVVWGDAGIAINTADAKLKLCSLGAVLAQVAKNIENVMNRIEIKTTIDNKQSTYHILALNLYNSIKIDTKTNRIV